MSERKSELWWVSVGGGDCEPARVVDDTKQIFTIGCPDHLTEADGVRLIKKIDSIPKTPEQETARLEAWRRKVERDEKRGIHHGYRRFP